MSSDFFAGTIPPDVLMCIMGIMIIMSQPFLLGFGGGDQVDRMTVDELAEVLELAEQNKISVGEGIKDARDYVGSADHDIAQTENRIEELKVELDRLLKEMDDLETQRTELEEKARGIPKRDLPVARAKAKELEAEKQRLQAEVADLKDVLEDMESAKRRKDKDREDALKEKKKLEDELERQDKAIADLREQLDGMRGGGGTGFAVECGTDKDPLWVDVTRISQRNVVIPIDDQNYDNWVGLLKGSVVDVHDRRSSASGETADQLRAPASNYRAFLEKHDPEKEWIVFVVRQSLSFEAFRAAREVAIESGFQTGWEPFAGEDNGRLVLGKVSADDPNGNVPKVQQAGKARG